MPTISLKEFEILCQNRQRYEGYVEGLGYVYWVPKYFQLPVSGLPSQTPYNTPRDSQFTIDLYELVVVKDEKNADKGIEGLRSLKNIGVDALSLYGIAKSIESMSTKPITLGSEYIQVNPQGTVKYNLNRNRTTTEKIAKGVGNKILGLGIIVDLSLAAVKEQTWEEAGINIAVNTGIWAVGTYICPPAAVVLGIAWFILSSSSGNHIPLRWTYEELHGSNAPADKTRVAKRLPPVESSKPVYEQKQYYFKQGKR
jgi:hypothetical protein